MTFQEKILDCRKKAGLSQEALAEKPGVSRQAIKWETGESVPELPKLVLLADVFAVTTDWLLRDEGPTSDLNQPEVSRTWADALPGAIGKLIRAYGWLGGVYIAISGFFFAAFGTLARYMARSFFNDPGFGMPGGGFFLFLRL